MKTVKQKPKEHIDMMLNRIAEDFTNADLQDLYRHSEASDVITVNDRLEDLIKFTTQDPKAEGLTLPWADTHDKIRLKPGQLSIWAGINGHKKSTCASQVLLHCLKEVRVGIASFEMEVKETFKLMCKQAAACDVVTEDFARDFAEFAQEKVFWYEAMGGVKPLEAIGAIAALADRGCKIILVDSLQFCGVSDDTGTEKLFMNQLVGLCKALQIHVMLVHHIRKPSSGGDEYKPTRFDVRGSGSIVDQAHLLLICWHNKAKADALHAKSNGFALSTKDLESISQFGFELTVAKQRALPFEGMLGLHDAQGQTFSRRDGSKFGFNIPRTGKYNYE